MGLPEKAARVYHTRGLETLVRRGVTHTRQRISELLLNDYSHYDCPYLNKIKAGRTVRPHYGYCLYVTGLLAQWLDYDRVSVGELGVAKGDGLRVIERHVEEIEQELDVTFEVYGFDLGSGLPSPQDYRDIPYLWSEGEYEMDYESLNRDLSRSELVIGDVSSTCATFFDDYDPAPLGCLFFDLDFYSSTMESFQLLDTSASNILPRLLCYFDDVSGDAVIAYNEYTGELGAISDYNETHANKIGKIQFRPHLEACPIETQRLYMYHRFDHELYTQYLEEKPDVYL